MLQELYDMYLEEEEILRIVEVVVNNLDFDLNLEDGPADLYLVSSPEDWWRTRQVSGLLTG